MSLVCGYVCSGNQTSQSLAVISNDDFTALGRRGDQIGEMIFGFVDVYFVNQGDDILGRWRKAVNEKPAQDIRSVNTSRAGYPFLLRHFIAAG